MWFLYFKFIKPCFPHFHEDKFHGDKFLSDECQVSCDEKKTSPATCHTSPLFTLVAATLRQVICIFWYLKNNSFCVFRALWHNLKTGFRQLHELQTISPLM